MHRPGSTLYVVYFCACFAAGLLCGWLFDLWAGLLISALIVTVGTLIAGLLH